jgi:hypothetical protein
MLQRKEEANQAVNTKCFFSEGKQTTHQPAEVQDDTQ